MDRKVSGVHLTLILSGSSVTHLTLPIYNCHTFNKTTLCCCVKLTRTLDIQVAGCKLGCIMHSYFILV